MAGRGGVRTLTWQTTWGWTLAFSLPVPYNGSTRNMIYLDNSNLLWRLNGCCLRRSNRSKTNYA